MKRNWFLLLIIIPSMLVYADSWQWIGPSAGTVKELIPDRRNPNLWFSVNNQGLYRSEDGGLTWQKKSLREVLSVFVNPISSEVLAIVRTSNSKSQIWVSHDTGKNFTLRNTVSFPLRKIFPDPEDRNLIYGVGDPAYDLVVSNDGGLRWRVFNNLPTEVDGLYGYLHVTDFLVSPFNSKHLHVSGREIYDPASYSVYFESRDAGKTWKREGAQYGFHWDPAFPERAFSFNASGIRKLKENGWTKISNQPASEIVTVPDAANVLIALTAEIGYLRTFTETFRSNDSGKNWVKTPLDLQNNVTVLASAGNSRGFLAGTAGGGIYRKTASDYKESNTGIREALITDIESSGSIPIGLSSFAEYSSEGRFLFQRQNEKSTWSNLGFQLPLNKQSVILAVAVHPTRPELVFVVLEHKMLRSINGGKQWSTVFDRKQQFISDPYLAFDPGQPDVLYFSQTNDAGVYRSSNAGASFEKLPLDLDAPIGTLRILVDPMNSQILYFVSPEEGILKSSDGGRSVQYLRVFGCTDFCKNGPLDMVPLPQRDSYLALLRRGQIMKSVNGGQSWIKIGQVSRSLDYSDHARIVAADHTGNKFLAIFSSASKSGLHESLDGGRSWKDITSQLGSDLEVFDLTDPRSDTLFVATNRGVYKRN